MDLGIEDSAALISASSGGLGKAAAKSLVQKGVNVAVNGRDEDKLYQTVEELNNLNGGRAIGCKGDITEKQDILQLVEKTHKEFGKIDHVITSAGGPPSLPFTETSDQDWYEAFDLLVMSVVRLVRETEEYLRDSKHGTITLITSISVKEAIEDLVLSNSVRMSLIGLMKTLSKELGPDIRVNAILQGAHETERIKNLIEEGVKQGKFANYEEGLDFWAEDIPLNRIGQPSELGDLVAFLCSEKSSFLNGTAIPLDGGGSKSNL